MTKRARTPPNVKGSIPDDILKLETQQGRCPQGHRLPHRTNRGRCTPVFCAGSSAGGNDGDAHQTKSTAVATGRIGAALKAAKAEALAEVGREANAIIDAMIPGESISMQTARAQAKASMADELQKLGASIGKFAAMRAYFKAPEGLQGAEAMEYVQKKAESLTVDAITDLERDLKLGDDAQRREARRDLLDMNGMRKKEQVANSHPVIVMVGTNGAPQISLPWSTKTKTITAEVSDSSNRRASTGTAPLVLPDTAASGRRHPSKAPQEDPVVQTNLAHDQEET